MKIVQQNLQFTSILYVNMLAPHPDKIFIYSFLYIAVNPVLIFILLNHQLHRNISFSEMLIFKQKKTFRNANH